MSRDVRARALLTLRFQAHNAIASGHYRGAGIGERRATIP
jgi:hypothetical protein